MPITGSGWELHIVRASEQHHLNDGRVRTVGTYQIFHNGAAQDGPSMQGTTAESRGPGANRPAGNGKRVEPGRYPLATQDGENYKTLNYSLSEDPGDGPRPGFELLSTGQRSEILVHPGHGFLASIGCINPCTALPDANESISYAPSRRRVIALIEDMKQFCGADFPHANGERIPRCFVVIDGEP
ncbi:MAG TPA: hypothetical protein VG986_02320 [Pseudolabrys sp.]|nr:hypothetical protein [Pseudolabrys sp.]